MQSCHVQGLKYHQLPLWNTKTAVLACLLIPAWLLSILASASVSVALTAALVWLSKTWISERVKGAIEHEYAQKLETFKSQLKAQNDVAIEQLKTSNTQLLAVHTSASNTFGSIHGVAHERRLKGIEAVWGAILDVRNETPAGLLLADTFPENEYDRFFFQTPQLQQFLSGIDMKAMSQLKVVLLGHEVEKWRPFMGEYIYSLYEAYRTLTLRVFVITAFGIAKGHVEAWYRDDVNRNLVTSVLTAQEQAGFERSEVKFSYIRSAIEKKIIEKSARIVSGEASAAHMLEQARRFSMRFSR